MLCVSTSLPNCYKSFFTPYKLYQVLTVESREFAVVWLDHSGELELYPEVLEDGRTCCLGPWESTGRIVANGPEANYKLHFLED